MSGSLVVAVAVAVAVEAGSSMGTTWTLSAIKRVIKKISMEVLSLMRNAYMERRKIIKYRCVSE